MPRKLRHKASFKKDDAMVVSSVDATLYRMPKYNGFACGYGPHGKLKYHRPTETRSWKKELES